MSEYDLSFSPLSSEEYGSYKLVELTPDLATSIEGANTDFRLTIKGHSNDNAVLCTMDKTFTMRSVALSNTILAVTPVPDEHADNFADDVVVIRDQLNEIIELIPIVPRLHGLFALIKDQQYDEGEESETENDMNQTRFTYQDALEQLQASEKELERELKERRILVLNNELRPIAPTYLSHLLELILNLLVSLSMKHNSVPVEDLISALADHHEVRRAVSKQVICWFGETKESKWAMDVAAVVREIGLGIVRNHKHEPIEKDALFAKWKAQIGDSFESSVSLDLLAGNYIEYDVLGSDVVSLKYFPAAALPVDPAARFSDLFLTRSMWTAAEIVPFLTDIAINAKERDKLLLKYCRAVSDVQGVKYTARVQYTR